MKQFTLLASAALSLCLSFTAFSQTTPDSTQATPTPAMGPITPERSIISTPAPATQAELPAPIKKWYERISLRGYAQVRYNRIGETNPDLRCEQCDRSWGRDGGFFLRRVRLIFSGNIHERVFLYVQPDIASSASSTGLHFAQLRDAYFDLAFDKKLEFRVRLGQSKIPYGFENMQSSQNRIPLDRNDALNSAVANERDLGAFFYYAPAKIRTRFAELIATGLKGSGDYGVVGLGMFNGQTANRPEGNGGQHIVGRVSYPFKLRNGQFIEPGIQAYSGRYAMQRWQLSPGTVAQPNYIDERVAASLVIYPQPFGFQMEYNIGRGPEFNPETKTIETRPLEGGYAMMMYRTEIAGQTFIPFTRAHYYNGGKKHELDARKHRVRELEIGVEWQPFPTFELVAMYTISDRVFEDFLLPNNRQAGRLLRLQAQVNY